MVLKTCFGLVVLLTSVADAWAENSVSVVSDSRKRHSHEFMSATASPAPYFVQADSAWCAGRWQHDRLRLSFAHTEAECAKHARMNARCGSEFYFCARWKTCSCMMRGKTCADTKMHFLPTCTLYNFDALSARTHRFYIYARKVFGIPAYYEESQRFHKAFAHFRRHLRGSLPAICSLTLALIVLCAILWHVLGMSVTAIVCLILGLLAAPCTVWFNTSMLLYFQAQDTWQPVLMLSLAVLLWGLWVFMRSCFSRASSGNILEKPHIITLPAWCLGSITLLNAVLFYLAAIACDFMAAPSTTRECPWNMLTVSALASTGQLSLRLYRDHGKVGVLPILLQVLLLPLNTPDRMPFASFPRWPSPIYHASLAFAVICAVLSMRKRGELIIAMCEGNVYEQMLGTASAEISVPTRRELFSAISVRYDYLPFACALLSMAYLVDCHWFHRLAPYTILNYHIVWSLLRPCYAYLFAFYWLKRLPYLAYVQAWLCGTGFIFFYVLCPITRTELTIEGGNLFDSPTEPQVYNHLSHGSHRVEAFCFYLSAFWYGIHGYCSGIWQSQTLDKLVLAYTVVHASLLLCIHAAGFPDFFVTGVVIFRYVPSYGFVMLLAGCSILGLLPGQQITVALKDELDVHETLKDELDVHETLPNNS